MAIESRPVMTSEQFEEAASFLHEGHWYTGEECFIHIDPVMQIEGWDRYGSAGFNQLTEPQQVLMMWSDLVGQTSNGGFTQFVDNLKLAITLAHSLIPKLDWPELTQRFNRALTEQVGDPSKPVIWEPVYEVEKVVHSQMVGDKTVEITVEKRGELLNGDDCPPEDEADAFNDWFFQDSTKEQSTAYVSAYVRRNRDQLCLIQV